MAPHECDACGETFKTLTRLRLHEKDDCPERQQYADLDPTDSDVGNQTAAELVTCRGCGRENPHADFEFSTDYDGSDYHYIVEFDCQHCEFENENRAVMTGVDASDLEDLPQHLQPDQTQGGKP